MSAGRKRAFDRDEALKSAMQVFWRKGYIGASMSELTQNMGINKPSLYGAFGNKETLFVEATRRYIEDIASRHLACLHEAGVPLATRLKNFMHSALRMQCATKHPMGCYVVLCQSEIAAGDMPEEAASLLNEAGEATQARLAELFRTDPEARALGLADDAESKALCLATTLRGTASMARAGQSIDDLEKVIEHSLAGIGLDHS